MRGWFLRNGHHCERACALCSGPTTALQYGFVLVAWAASTMTSTMTSPHIHAICHFLCIMGAHQPPLCGCHLSHFHVPYQNHPCINQDNAYCSMHDGVLLCFSCFCICGLHACVHPALTIMCGCANRAGSEDKKLSVPTCRRRHIASRGTQGAVAWNSFPLPHCTDFVRLHLCST